MAEQFFKLSLEQEKILANAVKQHACIYDKKIYAGKNGVDNAWNEIAEKLDFIENGEMGRALFDRLRKRYNRKRNNVKKAKKYGYGDTHQAENALEDYQFLGWLNNYIFERARQGSKVTPNLHKRTRNDMSEMSDHSNGSDTESSNIYVFAKVEDDDNDAMMDFRPTFDSTIRYCTTDQPSREKNMRLEKEDNKTHAQCSTLDVTRHEKEADDPPQSKTSAANNNLCSNGQSILTNNHEESDSIEIYLRSLAADLRSLKGRDLIMAKHEINNIVFKYQMSYFDKDKSDE